MAYKVNGAFTGGVIGAGAGVVFADDLALITLHALSWDGSLPPEVLAAWGRVLTGAYGLVLTVLLSTISKFVSPYLLEKGNDPQSPARVPGS